MPAVHLYPPAPSTERGQSTHLSYDPHHDRLAYPSLNNIIVRSASDPLGEAIAYQQHAHKPTACRFSPSGGYVASGDISGVVRVWSPDHEDLMLKREVGCIGGAIKDIAWSGDNQRLVAVGDGGDKFGHAFILDTGTSVGDIGGHGKRVLSCDFKPTRPFRVATCGEDFQVNFHEGPPFKFKCLSRDHTRFVNCVRFSPDGNTVISAGSDSQGILFDGKEGTKKGELDPADKHKGSIFSCAWSLDGSRIATASGDKTVKLWDAETCKLVSTFTLGDQVSDMQVGVVFTKDSIVSLSLGGELNYLDAATGSVSRVLDGHQVAVTSLAATGDASMPFFSGASDGRVRRDIPGKGTAGSFSATSTANPRGVSKVQHANAVVGLAHAAGSSEVISVSIDDTLAVSSAACEEGTSPDFGANGKTKLSSAPSGVAAGKDGVSFVARVGSVDTVKDGNVVSSAEVKYAPLSIACSPDGAEVAVGGDDNKVHLFAVGAAGVLEDKGTIGDGKHRQVVTSVSYSPDGSMMASADAGRAIFIWEGGECKIEGWVFHTSRITSVAWSPNSERLASGALDGDIYVWSTKEKSKRVFLKGSHKNGVNVVTWLDDTTLVSGGQDACIRQWTV